MTNAEKEIRDILLGRTVLTEDGRLCVPQKGEFRLPGGVSDGAGAIRFLGMLHRTQAFETERRQEDVLRTVTHCFQNMGRAVILREQQDTPACLIRYILTKPLLLTFGYREGIPVLTAWSARSVTGLFSVRRALKAFDGELPEDIRLSEQDAPKEPADEKTLRKRAKKEEKAKKKAEKKKEKEEKKAKEKAMENEDFFLLKRTEEGKEVSEE
ncbi:MAG: hypothetical protein K5772_08275 [Clostridia bacterium]|nr:hypothetical protein [Clostridia bacterium]